MNAKKERMTKGAEFTISGDQLPMKPVFIVCYDRETGRLGVALVQESRADFAAVAKFLRDNAHELFADQPEWHTKIQ